MSEKNGKCTLFCPKLHEQDPKSITKEFIAKCVHNRQLTNIAEEADEEEHVVWLKKEKEPAEQQLQPTN